MRDNHIQAKHDKPSASDFSVVDSTADSSDQTDDEIDDVDAKHYYTANLEENYYNSKFKRRRLLFEMWFKNIGGKSIPEMYSVILKVFNDLMERIRLFSKNTELDYAGVAIYNDNLPGKTVQLPYLRYPQYNVGDDYDGGDDDDANDDDVSGAFVVVILPKFLTHLDWTRLEQNKSPAPSIRSCSFCFIFLA